MMSGFSRNYPPKSAPPAALHVLYCLARFLTFAPSLTHLAATKTHNNNCAYPQSGTIPVSTCYGDTDGTITMQHKDFYTPHTSIICILRSCA